MCYILLANGTAAKTSKSFFAKLLRQSTFEAEKFCTYKFHKSTTRPYTLYICIYMNCNKGMGVNNENPYKLAKMKFHP